MKKQPSSGALLGAQAILERIDAMRREIPRLRAERDPECLHRMRVASRRLRAALGIFERHLGKVARKWRKQVRWLTGTLGRARDLDVQIEQVERWLHGLRGPALRAGPETLRRHLRSERKTAQDVLDVAVNELDSSGVLEHMRRALRHILAHGGKGRLRDLRPLKHRWARRAIAERLEEFLSYRRCVGRPELVEELHEMRIASKRLRYALEVFVPHARKELGRHVKAAKEIQALLGDVHDCDVWIQFLPEFLKMEGRRLRRHHVGRERIERLRPGLESLREDRRAEREKLFRRFVAMWARLEKEEVWKQLSRRVRKR